MCALKEKEKLCSSKKKREVELHMKVSQFCIQLNFFFYCIHCTTNCVLEQVIMDLLLLEQKILAVMFSTLPLLFFMSHSDHNVVIAQSSPSLLSYFCSFVINNYHYHCLRKQLFMRILYDWMFALGSVHFHFFYTPY